MKGLKNAIALNHISEDNSLTVGRKSVAFKTGKQVYSMYYSDTSHLYLNGERIKMSCLQGSPTHNLNKQIMFVLKNACLHALKLRECNGKKKGLEDIASGKGQIVVVREARRRHKIHVFKMYNCGHVYYNQAVYNKSTSRNFKKYYNKGVFQTGYSEQMLDTYLTCFYPRFERVERAFGYEEYLRIARNVRKISKSFKTTFIDCRQKDLVQYIHRAN